MYGSYGYGGGYGALAASTSVGLLLGFIAFIAAIVVTVLFYKKYVAVDNIHEIPGFKHDWGPFFRFEHLIIENILKVLYIFTASLILFECAALIISSLFSIMYDPGATLVGIIVIAIVCFVLEVLNRLGFEFSLLTVLIWKNTSAIRKSVAGDSDPSLGTNFQAYQSVNSQNATGQSYASMPQTSHGYTVPQPPSGQSFGSAPAQGGATQNSAQPQTQPVQPVQPTQPVSSQVPLQSTAWTCPSCGAFNKSGAFCAQCGTRKNN